MSLKPLKKIDMNKSWMKKRRDKQIKIQPEYHLIVTEGTKTEPEYFRAIRDIINSQYKDRVQLDIYEEGENTLNLFDRAQKHVNNSPNIYKHVWIVYDTDDFPSDHINKTAQLCENCSNDETTYHAIWSNQCIELWFLLHFSYFQSDIYRQEYWEKLSKSMSLYGLGTYTKGRSDMYMVLRPYLEIAIQNAKRLDEVNKGRKPSMAAPGTRMHEMLQTLKPYLG